MEADGLGAAGGLIGGLLVILSLGGMASLVGRLRDVPIRASWVRQLRRRGSAATEILPPHEARDVFAPSGVRRAQARRASAGRVVAAMVAVEGLVGLVLGRPVLLLLIPTGGALGLVLPKALSRRAGGDPGPMPERPPRRLRLKGLRVAAVLPWVVSLGAGIVGITSLGIFLLMNAAMEIDGSGEGSTTSPLAVFLLAFVIAGASHRVARRLAQRNAIELMARDERAPCLLLRSFADDGLRMFSSRSTRHTFLERLGIRRTERFEELLAWTLQAYGPVIAVAEPGDRGRPLGAAREQIRDPDWLPVVAGRLASSAHVVLVAGRTEGLGAEVKTIRELGLLNRTVFVIPPVRGPEASHRWDHVAQTLGLDVALGVHDEGTVLVTVADDAAVVYQGHRRDDLTYETALDMALTLMRDESAGVPEHRKLRAVFNA